MSDEFEYIKKYYHVTEHIKKGMKISVNERLGVITGADGHYLMVQFNGEDFSTPCHPTWKVEYHVPVIDIIAKLKESEAGGE